MVNERHKFLQRLIGTKPEEDISLDSVNTLSITITTLMVVVSSLEITFYFIYNNQVTIMESSFIVIICKKNIVCNLTSYSFIKFHPWGKIINACTSDGLILPKKSLIKNTLALYIVLIKGSLQ